MFTLHWFDILLISSYFLVLIGLSFYKNRTSQHEEHFLLSGRKLTLPAFVATLVSTWYGGILGVGEFTWLYGVSQWIAMGLPYYFFAILFAIFIAGKVRRNPALTIPEAVRNSYGEKAGQVSAVLIFLLTNPAPYILMVALLAQILLGTGSFLIIAILVAGFSALYVGFGGFTAVVRTDMLQVIMMYGGFFMLIVFTWIVWGNPLDMWNQLPETSTDPTGGQPITWLIVWFFIAMWTFVDPSFHQRAAAAKNEKIAKNGILTSVGLWFVFDMLTLTTALYGVVYLSDLDNPVLVYPEIAITVLPVGLTGLFFLALLATIMSTLDSFLFISGQTLGRDLFKHLVPSGNVITLTRWGIAVSALASIVLVWLIPSVIDIWYIVGSILIPGLIIPVVGIYLPMLRIRSERVVIQLTIPVIISFTWFLTSHFGLDGEQSLLNIEPFYPGLLAAALLFLIFKEKSE